MAIKGKIHRTVYIALLCLLTVFMTTSVFLTNLVWFLLLANWVAEWNWREKFRDFRHQYALHAILALAGVYLLWSIGCENTGQTLEVLRIKMPLLAIPLVALTSTPLQRKEALSVAVCYVGTVFVVSLMGLWRYLTLPGLAYRDIVPHISHIRFGLNVCLCIVLLAYIAYHHPRPWMVATAGVGIAWLLCFLLLLRAYTAFIALLALALVLPIAYRKRLSTAAGWVTIGFGIAVWLSVAFVALYYHHEYYTPVAPSSQTERPLLTANGNAYLHRNDGLIENGNYVHQYVCEKEMRTEWAKLSDYPFDSLTPVGYTVYPALLRYLNALGATKDSVGMQRLRASDVAAIEQGIANPVYLQRGPRKMFYVLFYEYENYRCFRSVSNFSTLQRIELWEAGWHVAKRHPLVGVGTGDVDDVCHEELVAMQSPLAESHLHLHNQYLTFLVAFGALGTLAIAFFFLRAWRKGRMCRSALFTAHLVIVLVSFMADNTLSTLAGITFVVAGYSLLARIEHPTHTISTT